MYFSNPKLWYNSNNNNNNTQLQWLSHSLNLKCSSQLWCNQMTVPYNIIICSTSHQLIRCTLTSFKTPSNSKWWWCILVLPLLNSLNNRISMTMLTTSLPIPSMLSPWLCTHSRCKTKLSKSTIMVVNSRCLISMEIQSITMVGKIPNRRLIEKIIQTAKIKRPLKPKNRLSEHEQKNYVHSWIRSGKKDMCNLSVD